MDETRMITGRDIHSLRCWYARNAGAVDHGKDKELFWIMIRMPTIIHELELLHGFRKISNQTFKHRWRPADAGDDVG